MRFLTLWPSAVSAALFAVIAFAATPALGQSCPPGMIATGGGNAGWVGCNPAYDPWAGVSVDTDPTPGWARGPSIDPLAGRIEAATTIFMLVVPQQEQRIVSIERGDPTCESKDSREVWGNA